MEKYTMVKTEVQENGDIYLFYVDENGSPVEKVSTIDQEQLQQLQENYVLEELPLVQEYVESTEEATENIVIQNVQTISEVNTGKDKWLDEEVEKLLIFYIDNKEAFRNPAMKKVHLWTVACKTMLIGKNPTSCDMKIRSLMQKYTHLHNDYLLNKTDPKIWPFYRLCHQAFEDNDFVQKMLRENGVEKTTVTIPTTRQEEDPTSSVINKLTKFADKKVKQMLTLYKQYKKEGVNDYMWQKHVWGKIAIQIGEDAEFWHKKFLNYKQHYIRMIEKRNAHGAQSVTWPYMELFDQIFGDDSNFNKKYGTTTVEANKNPPRVNRPVECNNKEKTVNLPAEWNDTEKTVLVKYYFDCIGEFQDSSIPNAFLWTEVGRLLDKKPEECRSKYEQLKNDHLMEYIGETYNLRSRKPISILFDNIISQEVENIFYQESNHLSAAELKWKTEKLDEMVQFLFDNIEMFKDPICHFVCWAAVALKINDDVQSCKEQWNDLTALYKGILNDKKEDSDLQIDWRYIEIFDRIFDYGMDTKLLDGYENQQNIRKPTPKTVVLGGKAKKVTNEGVVPENLSDLEPEEFEDKSSSKHSKRGIGDPKQIKILEYYLKYKDKFGTTPRKKLALWASLASTLYTTAEQCAQSFKNLKQVYMAYIQREINKPDKPILWPYFALCKKAFGYRVIKNKMKQSVLEFGDAEEWTPREIKILINYFGQNRNVNDSNAHEASNWASLAKDINKSETACRDKFIDLRRSYRKIITMMGRNPDCKINWKYFKFFDEIYSKASVGGMEVDSADGSALTSYQLPPNAVTSEIQDDDLQCIIVIPEGDENTNANDAQIIINKEHKQPKAMPTWSKKQKISLLKHLLEYIKAHEGKVIDKRNLMKEISSKINKTAYNCSRLFAKMKVEYKQLKDAKKFAEIERSPFLSILHKIMSLKPKFVLPPLKEEDIVLTEQTTYQDVAIPLWKVGQALKYYLEHIEEFVDPKYDQKTAWINLAKSISVRVVKIFNKINFLKQLFNSETNEVNRAKFAFTDTLKQILEKELEYRITMGSVPEPMSMEDDETEATVWTDEEIEQLLTWYLSNLDKFKSSKYVPSYLWMEASKVLSKGPVACSNQMTAVRRQYSAMVKENPDALNSWRFYELCQKIYGTGKKNTEQEQQQ